MAWPPPTRAQRARRPLRAGGITPRDAVVRVIDVSVSLTALTLLLPLLAVVAAAIKADSRGPVFFRQPRHGLNDRVFTMYKFRTMHGGGSRLLGVSPPLDEGGPSRKSRRDPRVTPVGRLLRTLSIDEIPQLVNVVKGDMSLVGPRPAMVEEAARYAEVLRERTSVRPGLTGLAQINGRSDLPIEAVAEWDRIYVNARSVRMYLWILLKTVPFVLSREGAY